MEVNKKLAISSKTEFAVDCEEARLDTDLTIPNGCEWQKLNRPTRLLILIDLPTTTTSSHVKAGSAKQLNTIIQTQNTRVRDYSGSTTVP
jgi:hypothetical protein